MLTILLSSSYMLAQRSISGVVSDRTGPLPGASVAIKGSSSGVTTDFDGKFSLNVPDNKAI